MEFTKKSEDQGVVVLGGELTIEHVEEIKALLLKALEEVKHVQIELKDVEEIDLACLQLFFAARNSASKKAKTVSLSQPIPEVCHDLARGAGLTESLDALV